MDSAPSPTRPADPDPDTASDAPAARAGRRPRDMALSLLVLLVPVFLIVGIYRWVQGGDEPITVDPAPAVAEARAARAFPVAVPTGLPSGWLAASAAFRRDEVGPALRIGYLTPAGAGVQVVQRTAPSVAGCPGRPQCVEGLLAAELTAEGRPQGTVEVAGRTWQRYTARPGERALVLLEPDRTVIVVGGAAEAELTALAGALR